MAIRKVKDDVELLFKDIEDWVRSPKLLKVWGISGKGVKTLSSLITDMVNINDSNAVLNSRNCSVSLEFKVPADHPIWDFIAREYDHFGFDIDMEDDDYDEDTGEYSEYIKDIYVSDEDGSPKKVETSLYYTRIDGYWGCHYMGFDFLNTKLEFGFSFVGNK